MQTDNRSDLAPLVSVVIAAWNSEEVLGKSIKSALSQDIKDIEILVIDDASSDETHAKALSFSKTDPRVRVLQLERNSGPAGARNHGFAEAKGKFVAVLDADDTWAPNRLRNLLELISSHSADIIVDNIVEVNKDGTALSDIPFVNGEDFKTKRNININEYISGNLGLHGEKSLGYLKPLIATDFLRKNNITYDESLRNGEDFHLMLACLAAGANVWFTPEPHYRYTRGEASISHRSNPDHLISLIRADERFLGYCSDVDTKALMRHKLETTKNSLVTERVMDALKTGNLVKVIYNLAKRPQALPKLSQHLGEAFRKRVRN